MKHKILSLLVGFTFAIVLFPLVKAYMVVALPIAFVLGTLAFGKDRWMGLGTLAVLTAVAWAQKFLGLDELNKAILVSGIFTVMLTAGPIFLKEKPLLATVPVAIFLVLISGATAFQNYLSGTGFKLELATNYLKMKDYQAARSILLPLESKSGALQDEVYFLLGLVSENQGDVSGAIRYYVRSAKLDPKRPAAWLAAAQNYRLSGKDGAAKRSLARLLLNNPKTSEGYKMLAEILKAEGDWENLKLTLRAWQIQFPQERAPASSADKRPKNK